MVTHVKNNLITLLGPDCNDFIAWLNALEKQLQGLHTALSAVVNLINTVPIEEDRCRPKRSWSSKSKSINSISSDTDHYEKEDVVDIARHGEERVSKLQG